MKTVFLIATVLVSTASLAQNDRFEKAMKQNLASFETAKTSEDFNNLSNTFERIADAEKTQWLPFYYASLCQVLKCFQTEGEAKDKICDKAQDLLSKAEAIEKNSELECVKQMIYINRMMVDPMTRWQQYGPLGAQALAVAKKLDPSNPRPLYLEGQTVLNTPESFGGGMNAAKPILLEAKKLFENFKPASELHPNWGKDQLEKLLNNK